MLIIGVGTQADIYISCNILIKIGDENAKCKKAVRHTATIEFHTQSRKK